MIGGLSIGKLFLISYKSKPNTGLLINATIQIPKYNVSLGWLHKFSRRPGVRDFAL
jgi:hypothetical protein